MKQAIQGANGELGGLDWEWLNENNRAIALDYPIDPKPRNLLESPGGKQMSKYFQTGEPNINRVIDLGLGELKEFFGEIPRDGDPGELSPFWMNGWFPPLDAIAACALIYQQQPDRYVEVGSGNSTKFIRKLVDVMDLKTEIISIDPFPRADIDRLCDEIIREPLENLSLEFVSTLTKKDVFFVDSSHRSFQNSDVTVFFTEILPALPRDTVYGVHDIVLPRDYAPDFVPRFYNEQYLLAAYILGGFRDEVMFPCSFVAFERKKYDLERLQQPPALGPNDLWGSAYWARKK